MVTMTTIAMTIEVVMVMWMVMTMMMIKITAMINIWQRWWRWRWWWWWWWRRRRRWWCWQWPRVMMAQLIITTSQGAVARRTGGPEAQVHEQRNGVLQRVVRQAVMVMQQLRQPRDQLLLDHQALQSAPAQPIRYDGLSWRVKKWWWRWRRW